MVLLHKTRGNVEFGLHLSAWYKKDLRLGRNFNAANGSMSDSNLRVIGAVLELL